jgi:hypothetical protein
MAKPIEATPVLRGKDAQVFLTRMNSAVVSTQRLAWLRSVAVESKQAEQPSK